jgi:hypothetical protein
VLKYVYSYADGDNRHLLMVVHIESKIVMRMKSELFREQRTCKALLKSGFSIKMTFKDTYTVGIIIWLLSFNQEMILLIQPSQSRLLNFNTGELCWLSYSVD